MKYHRTDILNFIYNIQPWRHFMEGGCYEFYLILKKKFPKSRAFYNSDHVITKIDDRYYDASGDVKRGNHIDVDVYYTHKFMEKIFEI